MHIHTYVYRDMSIWTHTYVYRGVRRLKACTHVGHIQSKYNSYNSYN